MDEIDDAVLPLGARVDAYEIVGHLGRGGFGITYKVLGATGNEHFALKEFFPADLVARDGGVLRLLTKTRAEADYQWARRKFLDEARLLTELNHPNIVRVRRVFEANNTVYMLLDFVPGSTLEGWLRKIEGPPTQQEMDLIAGPLLSALEVVHRSGNFHLDIAPDNILIRSTDGVPILLDFGAARLEIKQRSQLVSAMLFKTGYSAPEQYTMSAHRYGPWTDIYGTSATFYRAITGKPPQDGSDRLMGDTLKSAADAAIAGHDFRPDFLSAIDWALRLKPDDRPAAVEQWRSRLLAPKEEPEPVRTTTQPRTRIRRTAVVDRPLDAAETQGKPPQPPENAPEPPKASVSVSEAATAEASAWLPMLVWAAISISLMNWYFLDPETDLVAAIAAGAAIGGFVLVRMLQPMRTNVYEQALQWLGAGVVPVQLAAAFYPRSGITQFLGVNVSANTTGWLLAGAAVVASAAFNLRHKSTRASKPSLYVYAFGGCITAWNMVIGISGVGEDAPLWKVDRVLMVIELIVAWSFTIAAFVRQRGAITIRQPFKIAKSAQLIGGLSLLAFLVQAGLFSALLSDLYRFESNDRSMKYSKCTGDLRSRNERAYFACLEDAGRTYTIHAARRVPYWVGLGTCSLLTLGGVGFGIYSARRSRKTA